jgi:predicted metal-dependent RNase
VSYISFSAHTDYKQTSGFIRALKPPHVILVHGEANEMNRLKAALVIGTCRCYDIRIFSPVKLAVKVLLKIVLLYAIYYDNIGFEEKFLYVEQ